MLQETIEPQWPAALAAVPGRGAGPAPHRKLPADGATAVDAGKLAA
jgi:hypothetical protein